MPGNYRNRPPHTPNHGDWREDEGFQDFERRRREQRSRDNIGSYNNYGIDQDRDFNFQRRNMDYGENPNYPMDYPQERHPLDAAFGTRMGNFGQIIYDPTYGLDTFGFRTEAPDPHHQDLHREYAQRGPDYSGLGPKNYRRSDERINDDIHQRLSADPRVDASNIEVEIKDSEVILSGTVNDRFAKRRAADIVESIPGVTHMENRIRVRQEDNTQQDYKYPNATTTGGAFGSETRAEEDKPKK